MKIAIIGYGKMGREIEKVAHRRSHEIVLKIDKNNPNELTAENLKNADIAFEFSTPDTAKSNFIKCFDAGLPVVSGTTGWLDSFDEIISIVEENGKSFFYAPNFSVGMNIFFEMNKKLAHIMNNQTDYDIELSEIHHTEKLDKPSGTAKALADQIIQNVERKNKWTSDIQIYPDDLKISAYRLKNVTGIHTIKYESDVDTIEMKHNAKNREGFALGAVLAAEFLVSRKGFFSMSDLLSF